MSFATEQNATSSMFGYQERLTQALEPYITEWSISITKDEIDLVAQIPEPEAAAMFTIWLSDKVTLFGMLWKEEWQKRLVAEANAREVASDLKQVEEDLERTEKVLQETRLALDGAARKELRKENRFLKRMVGSMGWEHASESDADAVGLGLLMGQPGLGG